MSKSMRVGPFSLAPLVIDLVNAGPILGGNKPNRKVPMSKCFSYITIALLATTVLCTAAPDKKTMMANENAAWQAYKDNKPDAFKAVVDKDYVGVYADGIIGRSKDISDMKRWKMKSVKISNYKMFSDEKDVVVTSYVVAVKGTVDGKDASGVFNAGTVWKSENGKWLAIFHTNVKQEAAK